MAISLKTINTISLEPHTTLENLFYRSDEFIEVLAKKMSRRGYDVSKPITINQDNYIIDGYSRYYAAMKAGIDEIPFVMKKCSDVNSMIQLAVDEQVWRRNLRGADILCYLRTIEEVRDFKRNGKSGIKKMSKRLHVGETYIKYAYKILDYEKKNSVSKFSEMVYTGTPLYKVAKEIPSNKGGASANSLKDTVIEFLKSNFGLSIDTKVRPALAKVFVDGELGTEIHELIHEIMYSDEYQDYDAVISIVKKAEDK